MGIVNICRPITLFNKQVPATPKHLDCDYLAFGDYDGISIGKNLLKQTGAPVFSCLWRTLLDESKTLKGEYISRTLFAFRCEDDESGLLNQQSTISDQTFHQNKNLPFLFITLLQYREFRLDKTFLKKHIEDKINTSWADTHVRAITYLSLDKTDIILLLKTVNYNLGWKIINDLHCKENTIAADLPEGPTLSLNYSLTIPSFSLDILNNPKTDFSLFDSPIKMVTFSAIERSPGSIAPLWEKLKQVIKEPDSCKQYSHLGNDDVILLWRNLTWKQLLPLYKKKQKSPMNPSEGLLIDEHDDYLSSVHSIATYIYPDDIEKAPQLLLFDHKDEKRLGGKLLYIGLAGSCGFYRENILNYMQNEKTSKAELSVQNARLTYGKTLLQILNALEKFERSDFPKYAFVPIFEPLKLFIELLCNNVESDDYGHITEQEFLNAINILVQNADTVDRQFFQAPEFNAGIYHLPAKLEAFYSAYIYNVTKLYNSLKQGEAKHTYKFLLCPWIENQTQSTLIFPDMEPHDRVILIKIPERFLYNPETLMIILGHEVGHFVGGGIRSRHIRRLVTEKIVCIGIVGYLKEYTDAGIYMSDKTVKQCIEYMFEKVKLEGLRYLNEHPDSNEYYEHSHYVKKYFYTVFNRIFLTHLDDMWNMIRGNYRCELSEQMNPLKLPDYLDYEDFAKKNADNLNKLEITVREMDRIWNRSLLKLTVQESNKIRAGIDSIMNFLIEGYADLISILSLALLPEKYLNSFVEIVEDVNTSVLTIRMCLVIKTMRYQPSNDEAKDSTVNWQDSWNELYSNSHRFNPELRDLIERLSRIMNQLDDKNNQKILFLEKSAVSEYYLFQYSKVWEYMMQYLFRCKEKIEAFIRKNKDSKDWKSKLNQAYREMCQFESVEKTLEMIEKTIGDYTEHIYQKPAPGKKDFPKDRK